MKTNVNLERINPKPQSTPITNALLSQHGTQTSPLRGIQVKCAYCKGGHFSASCEIVNDPGARFEILKRDGRWFLCLNLGHQITSCEKSCSRCNGNYHESICRRQTDLKPQPNLSANKNSQETQNSTLGDPINQSFTTPTVDYGRKFWLKGHNFTAICFSDCRKWSTKSTRVKIQFNKRSQRSYVIDNRKSRLGLKSTKKNASPQ